jgi:Cu/Ag efflux protein CusF
MNSHLNAMIAVAWCLALTACSSQPKQNETQPPVAAQPQPPPQQQAQTEPQRYALKGKVVAVDKSGKKVTIDHDAIPGFMGAMTMAYPVKDEHQLDNVSAGEQITATVVSSGAEYWVENIVTMTRTSEK